MPRYCETKGFLIHQRNFKDSSLILEFFSQEFGMMQILAKGIKNNKLLFPRLQYFSVLKIQYFGQSALKNLAGLDIYASINLESLKLQTSGLYLNELLHYSLIENEAAKALYAQYHQTLFQFGKQRLTILLRNFERSILKYNGFELDVSNHSNRQNWISVSDSKGLVFSTDHSQGCCQVIDLQNFLANESLDRRTQKRINQFMYQAINHCFSNRKIYSRELLKSLLP